MIRLLALIAILPSLAFADLTYKCKGADGKWAPENCPSVAETVTSNSKTKSGIDRRDIMVQNYQDSWTQLCVAQGGGDVGGECSSLQAAAFRAMDPIMVGEQGTPAQTRKAGECFQKWYKETLQVIDAVMWRYCYAN